MTEGSTTTESKVKNDFKSLGFLNLKSQNFSKISKFQDFSGTVTDLIIK